MNWPATEDLDESDADYVRHCEVCGDLLSDAGCASVRVGSRWFHADCIECKACGRRLDMLTGHCPADEEEEDHGFREDER